LTALRKIDIPFGMRNVHWLLPIALCSASPALAEPHRPTTTTSNLMCVVELMRMNDLVSPPTTQTVCINPGDVVYHDVTPSEAARWFFDELATEIKDHPFECIKGKE
jgi:hypothetical protein